MPVTQSATSAFQQDDFLSVFRHIADVFAGFSVIDHRAAGHFNNFIRTVFAEAPVFTSRLSMTGHGMAVVFEVKQRPIVAVTAQNDMAPSSAIASVGTSIRTIFFASHVRRASSALTRATVNLYVIYKIRFSHVDRVLKS